jgi:hypothetical protein
MDDFEHRVVRRLRGVSEHAFEDVWPLPAKALPAVVRGGAGRDASGGSQAASPPAGRRSGAAGGAGRDASALSGGESAAGGASERDASARR